MRTRADIIVRSDTELKLVVDVRGGGRSSADWAAKLRRNLAAHDLIPKTKYFLLALPDYLYLWKEKNTLGIIPPDYIVRTGKVLHLTIPDEGPLNVSDGGLELALTAWLRYAPLSEKPPAGSDAYTILIESGLLDAIEECEVIT